MPAWGCASSERENAAIAAAPGATKEGRPGASGKPSGKVSAELLALHAAWQAHRQADPSAPFTPQDPAVRVRDGDVLVDCTAASDRARLLSDLARLGVEDAAAYRNVVSGWLPIAAIPDLAELDSLALARAAAPATGGSAGAAPGGRAARSRETARAAQGASP